MEFFDTHITQEAKNLVMSCLNAGRLSEGEWVKQFEQRLEEILGYHNGVAVNSGTSALHLALILAGVCEGSEVILPAQTFVATGLAILYCGATPVFADIGMDGNISNDSVSKKITEKTRAVIAVSWGGNPCELVDLSEMCEENNIILIQDNAQALGATYLGKPITNWGDFSCFSFQAIKPLTTGDGGLLTCKEDFDYHIARDLRWFGISRNRDLPDETGERKYDLDWVGYKYHMNDYSAALGIGNLVGIESRQKRRKQIVDYYDDNIKILGTDVMPVATSTEGSSHWLYTLLVDKRNDFLRMMKSENIPVSVVHVGIDRNKVLGGINEDLVMQRYWDEHHVCLPCHAGLTDQDVEKVVEAVNRGW